MFIPENTIGPILFTRCASTANVPRMKPSQMFAVAVRVVGLVSLIYLLGSISLLFSGSLPFMLILRLIIWAIISIYLLRGAPALVSFAYPRGEG